MGMPTANRDDQRPVIVVSPALDGLLGDLGEPSREPAGYFSTRSRAAFQIRAKSEIRTDCALLEVAPRDLVQL